MLLHLDQMFPNVDLPFGKAYLAVDFFFMLSGFVLTRGYQRHLADGTLGPRKFLALRIRRLWPTIAAGALFAAFAGSAYHTPGELALLLALNIALVPCLFGGPLFPLNGAFWSIFFELVANLCHAAGLARVSRRALVMVIVVMAAVMLIVSSSLDSPGSGNGWDVGSIGGNFVAGFPRVMLSYCAGMLLFLTVGNRLRLRLRLPVWVAPTVMVALLIGGSAAKSDWRFDAAFVLVACPLILTAGLAVRAPANRVMRWMGDLSFPLYALHIPVFLLLPFVALPWFAGPPVALAAASLIASRFRRPAGSKLAGTGTAAAAQVYAGI